MTEDQRNELELMGYMGEAAEAVAAAWSVGGTYGSYDLPPQICPASMCGTPRLCHGSCVWCPFEFLRSADVKTGHRLWKLFLDALRAAAGR